MYGVSKITSEQNIMLTTFPGAQYSAQSLAEHLDVFAKAGIVVDMICQSAPRGSAVDFSFTTSYDNFAAVMRALPAAAKANPPLVSGGYSKINLFGEEMVTSCGVAARALNALAMAGIEVLLITTSDLDTAGVCYLEEYDAYYTFTSDFNMFYFIAESGEQVGNYVYLRKSVENGNIAVLTLRLVPGTDEWQIVSHWRSGS